MTKDGCEKIAMYRKLIKRLERDIKRKSKRIAKLEVAYHTCEKTLEYYSDPENFDVQFDPYSGLPHCQVVNENGRKAGKCLKSCNDITS